MHMYLLINIHTPACERLKLSDFKIIEISTNYIAVFLSMRDKSRTRTLGEIVGPNTR